MGSLFRGDLSAVEIIALLSYLEKGEARPDVTCKEILLRILGELD